jgi:hypothetical protein
MACVCRMALSRARPAARHACQRMHVCVAYHVRDWAVMRVCSSWLWFPSKRRCRHWCYSTGYGVSRLVAAAEMCMLGGLLILFVVAGWAQSRPRQHTQAGSLYSILELLVT